MESEYKSQKDLYFLFTLLTDFIGTTFYQKKSSPFENYSVDSNKNNEHFFWKQLEIAVDFHSIHLHYIELEE